MNKYLFARTLPSLYMTRRERCRCVSLPDLMRFLPLACNFVFCPFVRAVYKGREMATTRTKTVKQKGRKPRTEYYLSASYEFRRNAAKRPLAEGVRFSGAFGAPQKRAETPSCPSRHPTQRMRRFFIGKNTKIQVKKITRQSNALSG